MESMLTGGAIKRILNGETVDMPVLQLLAFKKIPGTSSGATDRYRLIVSDGTTCYPFVMLTSQLNHRIQNGELDRHAIIKLDKYICNPVQPEKKILILLEVTILVDGPSVGEKLGNPSPLGNAESTTTSEAQQQQFFGSRPAQHTNASNSGPATNIHPISSLTPYQNRWTIRARVTNKTTIRTWNNSRGEGKFFSIDMLDESGEIRATAFNDQCDKFYDIIEKNKVYYISKAALKTANKKFTSIKNDYEMSFTNETTVIPCQENVAAIPMLQFDFVPISELSNMGKDVSADVIGICKSTSDLQTLTSRTTQRELKKKDLHLVDKSNVGVTLTMWGDEAEKFDGSMNPVIAVKGARITDFGGCSLSMSSSSVLQINPDIREAHILRGWYDREGCNLESQSLSNKSAVGGISGAKWKTFAQAKGEMLGMGEKPDYYTTKATVVMVRRENCMYMACPTEQCNKKVVDLNNGMYRCEKCAREYPNFKWRLLLSVSLADFSENQWVTCFQEAAETLLGVSSQDLGNLKETDEERYNTIISDANFKSFIFSLRTKMEMFNEENRLKTTVASATPVDYLTYGQKLLSDIKQMESVL